MALQENLKVELVEKELVEVDIVDKELVNIILNTIDILPAVVGGGDMTKSVYDTDNDGIVDKSETVDDGAGNVSSASDVKDAVDKKHTQDTDQKLDDGGVNEIGVADVKDAVTKKHTQNTDIALRTDKLVVTVDGKVGIGTTTPTTKFQVVGSLGVTSIRGHSLELDGYGSEPAIWGYATKGTIASPQPIADDESLFLFGASGYDGINWLGGAYIEMNVDGAVSPDTVPGRITFWTTPNSDANFLERMRIDKDGNVGIGTATPGSLLDIYKDVDAGVPITLTNPNAGNSASAYIEMYNDVAGLLLGTNSSTYNAEPGSWFTAGVDWIDSDSANGLNIFTGGSAIRFGIGYTPATDEKLTIISTGVGIGLNNPAEMLDVNGNIRLSGNITDGVNISSPADIKDAVDRKEGIIGITIDGVGSVIATGYKGFIRVPYGCTITKATLLADVSGSIVIDVWKCAYADYDGGSTHPVDGDSITASAPPTISGATKSEDSTLTGWTKTISTGEILAFYVDSCATITQIILSLKVSKS